MNLKFSDIKVKFKHCFNKQIGITKTYKTVISGFTDGEAKDSNKKGVLTFQECLTSCDRFVCKSLNIELVQRTQVTSRRMAL